MEKLASGHEKLNEATLKSCRVEWLNRWLSFFSTGASKFRLKGSAVSAGDAFEIKAFDDFFKAWASPQLIAVLKKVSLLENRIFVLS